MYYEASRDFYVNFLPVLFMKTEEEAVKDAKAAGEDRYFPALEKVIVDLFFHFYTKCQLLRSLNSVKDFF